MCLTLNNRISLRLFSRLVFLIMKFIKNRNRVEITQHNAVSITERPDCDDFAQHSLAQSVLPDYLELVERAWRESVDRHRRAARWSHGDCLPFRSS